MSNSKMSKFMTRLILMLLIVSVFASTLGGIAFADEVETTGEEPTSSEVLDEIAQEAEEEAKKNTVSVGGDKNNQKEDIDDEELKKLVIEGFERTGEYADYYLEHLEYSKKLPEIVIDPTLYNKELSTAGVEEKAEFDGFKELKEKELKKGNKIENNVLDLNKNGDLVYTFNVEETGMYAIEFTYYAKQDAVTRDLEFAVLFKNKDGVMEAPFSSSNSLRLKRNWADEDSEPIYDGSDDMKLEKRNQLLPTQVISPKWITTDFYEPNGNYNDPLMYYLEKGEHTITIKSVFGTFALAQIRIHNDGPLVSYDDYIAQNDANGAKDATSVYIHQAEDYVDKSESIIQKAYDRSDPLVKPYSVSTTRLNTLGGTNWNESLGRVNYIITVPEDGYYELSFRYRQSFMRGTTIYRRLYIDDEVPFAEAEALAFEYGTGYQYCVSGRKDEKGKVEPYKIYLTAGEHELSLEAVIGDMAKASRDVEQAVYKLNYIYRKIIMITGTSPDSYRDYELFENVANLRAMLLQISDTLKEIKAEVDLVSTNKGGESEILNTLAIQVDSFIAKPYTIPSRLSTFKDNISSLGNWMINIRDIPLQLDSIILSGPNAEKGRFKANFFEKMSHEVNAFTSSFFDDYTAIGTTDANQAGTITAWVGTGRDQAIALKTRVDNDFIPMTQEMVKKGELDHEIRVNVSLVPLSVLSKAIVAGRGPEVALHVSRTEPLNLGFRNALVDLKGEFGEDYEKTIKERYTDYATIPYTLKTTRQDGSLVDCAYALPETQNFNMMFYRTDIFDELGIEPPDTWDEFDQILPVIQENNMTVGIESAISTNLFFTFMMQDEDAIANEKENGLVYANDGSRTMFEEQYAVDAFTKWTSYYTLYDFPLSYSWYTRFRNGEMPLVFEAYSNITYIAESAPELSGLWAVAPIPGTVDSTGKINRTEGSSGLSACSIVRNSKLEKSNPELWEQKKNDSWIFLKWWTSEDVMAEYGTRVEMAIGPVARYTTANIYAFEQLNWTAEEAAAIKEQRKDVKEVPELVGGYYVSRSITNAFRNVTNNYTNPREMLFYYNDQINAEIWRKRDEYNLSVPEEAKN